MFQFTLIKIPWHHSGFFNTIFVSSHMYPENPEETEVIIGSMNMGYISDTARNRTHNLFLHKRELIQLGHSDGQGLMVRSPLHLFDRGVNYFSILGLMIETCE